MLTRMILQQCEILTPNLDDAAALRGWEPMEQNWLFSLGGNDGIPSLSVTLANLGHL